MADGKSTDPTNLPFSHPLFLHPSETQGSTIISQILTGAENYTIWSRSMTIALKGKHKVGFVDGSCKKSDQPPHLKDQWERCNAVILSWLLNSISKELANGFMFHEDAHRVWADLKELFDKQTGSRIFALHREISLLRQGPSTVSSYFSKLKELWEEQSILVKIPSCQCSTSTDFARLIQQQRLLQFLMGLNESYSQARSHILL
ncbi:hypothetical protein QN277_015243 [Acacia crassicarpa]|uniref:Retrotransposon Copia-like N-terminal domain-containing protein n=1 Tax=Acacia crassicarpa TaxID=499986 RepID=A0AAE1JX67_9FABA|nr:hypothetical protein QN277_015243 [Acacia crassicarpa]